MPFLELRSPFDGPSHLAPRRAILRLHWRAVTGLEQGRCWSRPCRVTFKHRRGLAERRPDRPECGLHRASGVNCATGLCLVRELACVPLRAGAIDGGVGVPPPPRADVQVFVAVGLSALRAPPGRELMVDRVRVCGIPAAKCVTQRVRLRFGEPPFPWVHEPAPLAKALAADASSVVDRHRTCWRAAHLAAPRVGCDRPSFGGRPLGGR